MVRLAKYNGGGDDDDDGEEGWLDSSTNVIWFASIACSIGRRWASYAWRREYCCEAIFDFQR